MVFVQGGALRESAKAVNRTQGNPTLCRCCHAARQPQNGLIRKDRFRSGDLALHTPRRVAYARVSSQSQLTDRQTLRLNEESDELHIEQVSAVSITRPVFETVIAKLETGDTFVILDLDRAFRSTIDAVLTADALRHRGVLMRILSLPVDTTTAEGELFYTMVAAFANFERRIISRRTKEGLEAARRRGKTLGRPRSLPMETIREAQEWIDETGLPCRYVAALLGVSRITLQRGFRSLEVSD